MLIKLCSNKDRSCKASYTQSRKNPATFSNFDKNDSDMNFILLQRRFDASCIIFKLQVRTIRITFTFS